MNKLNKRLQKIADLVDRKVIADVGCDHGKIVLYLFENDKIDKAVISDISKPSLQKAIDLLNQKGYTNFVDYFCDGLTKYKESDKVEQIIIAGMGGLEMIQILKNSPISVKNVILQPQRNEYEVKEYLVDNNFNISYDIIIEDKDKFYNIIKANKVKNKNEITEFEILFGKQNFEEGLSDFKNYLDYLENKNKMLLEKLTDEKKKNNIIKMLENIQKAKDLLGVYYE